MLKKFNISFAILIFLLITIINTISCAEFNPVTDENLKQSFKEIEKSLKEIGTIENLEFSVSNNIINMTLDNEKYSWNYTLNQDCTFKMEIPIEKGMTYEKYKEKITGFDEMNTCSYLAIANTQNIDFRDAMPYITNSYIMPSSLPDIEYKIIDDIENPIIKKQEDAKIFYTSEFNERIIEFVNAKYKEKKIISDSDGFNTYTVTIEKKDMTETSGKLVCTLSISNQSDFSKLKAYTDIYVFGKPVTKETADYSIELKVGQKCKIETNEYCQDEIISSMNECIEFNEERTEITAKKVGIAKVAMIYNNTKKFFYIEVKENTNNEKLDSIILKIQGTEPSNNSNTTINTNTQKNTNTTTSTTNNTNTASSKNIPYAGKKHTFSYVIIFALALPIILYVKFEYINRKLR